jgi:glycosyltransferase involved in cell wall biosynthesis
MEPFEQTQVQGLKLKRLMKILVLTKRYTSARDMSRENIGRPYCLFASLGAIGHEVTFVLADYKSRETLDIEREKVRMKIRPLSLPRIFSFRRQIGQLLLQETFDILIAEGDPLFALLARGACARSGIPLVYDLMDNYETYDIYRIPFFRAVDRSLLARADLVVCVTEALREKVAPWRRSDLYVVGNGVDLEMFRPIDKKSCREKLGLPGGMPIIGYFGHIVDYKGINLLLKAHELFLKSGHTPILLLAGNKERSVKLSGRHCHYRGLLSQAEIPAYINACDLVAVPGPENAFTRYSFPLKILEAMACNVAVVASDIGPARELLGDDYPWLARPGDPCDLYRKIVGAWRAERFDLRERAVRHSWESEARKLEGILKGYTE